MVEITRTIYYVALSATRQGGGLSFPIYKEWTVSVVPRDEKKVSGWNSIYMGESCKGHNITVWWYLGSKLL